MAIWIILIIWLSSVVLLWIFLTGHWMCMSIWGHIPESELIVIMSCAYVQCQQILPVFQSYHADVCSHQLCMRSSLLHTFFHLKLPVFFCFYHGFPVFFCFYYCRGSMFYMHSNYFLWWLIGSSSFYVSCFFCTIVGWLLVKNLFKLLAYLCLASASFCKTVFINSGYKPSATYTLQIQTLTLKKLPWWCSFLLLWTEFILICRS